MIDPGTGWVSLEPPPQTLLKLVIMCCDELWWHDEPHFTAHMVLAFAPMACASAKDPTRSSRG